MSPRYLLNPFSIVSLLVSRKSVNSVIPSFKDLMINEARRLSGTNAAVKPENQSKPVSNTQLGTQTKPVGIRLETQCKSVASRPPEGQRSKPVTIKSSRPGTLAQTSPNVAVVSPRLATSPPEMSFRSAYHSYVVISYCLFV